MSSIVYFEVVYQFASDLFQARCYIHLRWSCYWLKSFESCFDLLGGIWPLIHIILAILPKYDQINSQAIYIHVAEYMII